MTGEGASRREIRFGIGEWYGKDFTKLLSSERKELATLQLENATLPQIDCPFVSARICSKRGGICSIRKYEKLTNGPVSVAEENGSIRTTCPSRFEQGKSIYPWIGKVLLSNADAVPIGQVNFLERVPSAGEMNAGAAQREVGRIDNVLLVPESQPLRWCPVEIQAVYFSGDKMVRDFEEIANHEGDGIPFPAGRRRPDYRSSGPKRLMPQLQIKVPALRRWGKKMAVVVDKDFYDALGRIETESDVSNCEVAWFVVRYDDELRLGPDDVHFTTLDKSVEGLIAGRPVSLEEFERRIVARLPRFGSSPI